MHKLLTIASIALLSVLLLPGCTATKIEYEQNNKGETKYSLWHNDHWMKTSTERLAGGMDKNGKFSVELAGRDSSPSEEFNRTMQTYTMAFVQLARLAAACYSPGTASIPLTTEAADPEAVAKITAAQSEANTAEIAAKSQRETAKLAAQTDAQVRLKEAEAKLHPETATTNTTATAESPATK